MAQRTSTLWGSMIQTDWEPKLALVGVGCFMYRWDTEMEHLWQEKLNHIQLLFVFELLTTIPAGWPALILFNCLHKRSLWTWHEKYSLFWNNEDSAPWCRLHQKSYCFRAPQAFNQSIIHSSIGTSTYFIPIFWLQTKAARPLKQIKVSLLDMQTTPQVL